MYKIGFIFKQLVVETGFPCNEICDKVSFKTLFELTEKNEIEKITDIIYKNSDLKKIPGVEIIEFEDDDDD